MKTELAKAAGTDLTTATGNAYEKYARTANVRTIVGDLLKYIRGDWSAGLEDTEVPLGTRLVADMDNLMVGWVRWWDNVPTDHIMGRVGDGYQPDRRSALGEFEKEEWEVNRQGVPRDPWQMTNYLLFADNDGHIYTYATTSVGGRNAVASLCEVYGKGMRQHPNEHPIVELGSRSYRHKEYGKTDAPTLTVVGWVDKQVFNTAMGSLADDTEQGDGDGDEMPFPNEHPAKKAAPKATAPKAKAATKF